MDKQKVPSFDLETGYNISLLTPNPVICDKQTTCVAVLNAPIPDVEYFVKVVGTMGSKFVRAEKINDTTITFITPGNFPAGSAKITIHHGENHNQLASYEDAFIFKSKLDEVHDLLQTTSDPIAFLSSVYGIDGSIANVDLKMAKNFNSLKPSQFSILKGTELDKDAIKESNSKNPTLLHFAARYNLIQLCTSLLECQGSNEALKIKNSNGDCPYNLAELCKNNDIARILSGLKSRNEDKVSTANGDEIYDRLPTERYKDLNIDSQLIYESMDKGDDDIYEPMFSSRNNSASSRQSAGQLSISSSNSDNSIDSPFALSARQKPDCAAQFTPALPPQEYSRPGKSPRGEFNRKSEEKKKGVPATPPPRPSKARPQKGLPILPNERKTPPMKPSSTPLGQLQNGSTSSLSQDDVYNILPSRANPLSVGNLQPPQTLPITVKADGQQTEQDDIYDIPSPSSNNSNKNYIQEDLYDTPPSRPTEDVYDTPPSARKSSQISSPNVPLTLATEKFQTPAEINLPCPPTIEDGKVDSEDDVDDIYDIPTSRNSENGLYVPAHVLEQFKKNEEDYDMLPSARHLAFSSSTSTVSNPLATVATAIQQPVESSKFSTTASRPLATITPALPRPLPSVTTSVAAKPEVKPDGFETYDIPNRATTTKDDLYDVPAQRNSFQNELNNRIGTRSGLSNSTQDLSLPPNKNVNGTPLRFDLGRQGKRMSEPVIISRPDQRLLASQQQPSTQRSHMPLPSLPPRNGNLTRSPGARRRGLKEPPPLPPQRKPAASR